MVGWKCIVETSSPDRSTKDIWGKFDCISFDLLTHSTCI